MSNRHPVSPRRQRNARRPNPPRRPRYSEPFPKDAHGTCVVGELLVPLFGRSWVDKVAASGGLAPYVLRLIAAFLISKTNRELPALLRDTEAYR